MKHVIIPATIIPVDKDGARLKQQDPRTGAVLKDKDGKDLLAEPITMFTFLCDFALVNPDLGLGGVGLRRRDRLKTAFRAAKEGDEVVVDDGDWEVVQKIFENIRWGNPDLAAQQLPVLTAWEKASEAARVVTPVEEVS